MQNLSIYKYKKIAHLAFEKSLVVNTSEGRQEKIFKFVFSNDKIKSDDSLIQCFSAPHTNKLIYYDSSAKDKLIMLKPFQQLWIERNMELQNRMRLFNSDKVPDKINSEAYVEIQEKANESEEWTSDDLLFGQNVIVSPITAVDDLIREDLTDQYYYLYENILLRLGAVSEQEIEEVSNLIVLKAQEFFDNKIEGVEKSAYFFQ